MHINKTTETEIYLGNLIANFDIIYDKITTPLQNINWLTITTSANVNRKKSAPRCKKLGASTFCRLVSTWPESECN